MTIQQNYIYNKINKDGTNSNITTLNFDTTYNALLTQAGQIGWNGDEGTFNFKTLKESVIQLGQELVLYGLAGEDIANGDVVMYGGTLGNRIIFRLARANTEGSLIGVTEDPKIILGVATSTISNGEYGYITRFGNINGIQTGIGWNPGDKLYFDIDASAALVNPQHGKITKTPSTIGNLIIPVGRVILPSQDTPAGRILVIPDTTLLLSSLADVNVNGIADGQYLKYESGSWVPGTPDAGGGSSGVWTGVLEFADVTTTAIKFASGSTIPATFGVLNTEAITNLNIGGASTNITIGGATTAIKLPSLVSANGDLLIGTNSGSLSKLSMGGAGTVLKVNSSGTGLEWGAVSGGGTSTPGYKAGDLITSGVGYIKYNGTTRVIGEWDSVTETAPSDTTKQLNFNGKLFASQVWGAVFNDYAELFKKDESLEAGDVVIKNENGDGYIRSQGAYDNRVVGVLSDTYSHIIGANKDMSIEENLVHNAPIGLAGRVYVKVIGKVKIGDLLVASPLKGVAMASIQFKPGTIIGKALEAHNSDVVSRIEMLILNA